MKTPIANYVRGKYGVLEMRICPDQRRNGHLLLREEDLYTKILRSLKKGK